MKLGILKQASLSDDELNDLLNKTKAHRADQAKKASAKYSDDVNNAAKRLLNNQASIELPKARSSALGFSGGTALLGSLGSGGLGYSKASKGEDLTGSDIGFTLLGGAGSGSMTGFSLPTKPFLNPDGLIVSSKLGGKGAVYGGLLGSGLSLGSLLLGKALGKRKHDKDQANLPIYKREGALNLGGAAVPLATLAGAGLGAGVTASYLNRPSEANTDVRNRKNFTARTGS